MKTKLLFLLLVVALLQMSVNSYAMALTTSRKIHLKDKRLSDPHRSMPIIPVAFINGSLLSVDFPSIVDSVTVVVKNVETGDIVHTCTHSNVSEVTINLAEEDMGKYILEIYFDANLYWGDFSL